MILIGIDPDIHKSGIAFYEKGKNILEVSNMSFFQIFDYLSWLKKENESFNPKYGMKVILEAGWLNKKSNWHNEKKGVGVASRIGKNTVSNHDTGRKIEEMLQYLNIPYELRKPIASKVDQKYFRQITGMMKETNQDQRDAAMLVWGY